MTPSSGRVVVLDDHQGVAASSTDWSALPEGLSVEFVHQPKSGDALAELLADATVVVAMRERTTVDAVLLSRLPRLELIVTTGMRNAVIDLEAARRRGVVVCGTRSLAGPATELTWALVMTAVRGLDAEFTAMRGGRWQTLVGNSLEGRRLGVVGLGHIGARIARIAGCFDMDVVAWSPRMTPERARESGAEHLPLDDLLATSDVVTLHVPLNAESHGLLGQEELRRMRPDAWLVNTSRGPLVDEAALLRAVREEWIAGAALDVYDVEPLPAEHPFRHEPGFLTTGHIGYVTHENYRTYFHDVVEDVVAHAHGAPLRVLNP